MSATPQKAATGLFEQISKYLQDNPSVWQGALAAGALGGLGGAALTPKGNPNESRAERNKRRLKNALILGGLGAGAGALLPMGMKNVAEEAQRISEGGTPDMNKFDNLIDNVWTRLGLGGAAGAATYMWPYRRQRKAALKDVLSRIGGGPTVLQSNLDTLLKGNPATAEAAAITDTASPTGLKSILNRIRFMGANPNEHVQAIIRAGKNVDAAKLGWKVAPNALQRGLRGAAKLGTPAAAAALLPELIGLARDAVEKVSPGDTQKMQNAATNAVNAVSN